MNSIGTDVAYREKSLARQCVICGAILEGILSYLFRIAGIKRSLHNPNICTRCNTHVEDGRIVKISVVFADISSFTEKTQERGPEQIHRVTDAFLKMATNILIEHDAYVDKYIGDAVMAFFNMPIQRNDHASQAVAAAFEIDAGTAELTEKFGIDLKAGVGIATGWAKVGQLGSKYRKDYTAIGDVVNMAARLEGEAKPREILIHSEVYEEVADDFPDAPAESLWLKGFKEPVLTYYLQPSIDRTQPTYYKESSRTARSSIVIGSAIFAFLAVPCVGVVLIGPLAATFGVGILFGAITTQWMFFDADVIRIPLLIVAALGSLSILFIVWHARRLRLQAQANGEVITMSQGQRYRTMIVIGLAVMTLVVVALGIAVHNFHFLMPM